MVFSAVYFVLIVSFLIKTIFRFMIEIFPIFHSALATKRPNLAEIVLDCLQRLVAHRHVQGVVTSVATSLKSSSASQASLEGDEDVDTAVTDSTEKVPYQASIIDMICR